MGDEMKNIKGMHHLSLKVGEMQYWDVVHFYQKELGLQIIRVQDGATFLSCGNLIIEILIDENVICGSGPLNHMAFEVENVDEILRILAAKGYHVVMEPTEHMFCGKVPYKVYIGFVEGVAGELIEFFQELS